MKKPDHELLRQAARAIEPNAFVGGFQIAQQPQVSWTTNTSNATYTSAADIFSNT